MVHPPPRHVMLVRMTQSPTCYTSTNDLDPTIGPFRKKKIVGEFGDKKLGKFEEGYEFEKKTPVS